MKKVKLLMRTTYAGPLGTAPAGGALVVPAEEAERLLAARVAEPWPAEKETAVAPPPEKGAERKAPPEPNSAAKPEAKKEKKPKAKKGRKSRK